MIAIDKSGVMAGVMQRSSPNRGGALVNPSLYVPHFTAGHSFEQSLGWLTNPKAKASAHALVGRRAELAQLVPLGRVAWHAGPSSWKGRTSCNRFAIGVELENFGQLTLYKGELYPWFSFKWRNGKPIMPLKLLTNAKPVPFEDVYTAPNGTVWHAYTELQLERFEEVTVSILAALPSIVDMAGHEDIAEHKSDPGPAFPWALFRPLLERKAS